ncbi:hypothetical protein [Streptomyces rugosispiralis]|uniref:hypothetical protein n=1 Tax=Streptomyces rugosispiralis TaxID=2967341 RepID=UPI0037048F42
MNPPRDPAIEFTDPAHRLVRPFFGTGLRGARPFAAADVVADVVAGLGAALLGAAFAQAVWA